MLFNRIFQYPELYLRFFGSADKISELGLLVYFVAVSYIIGTLFHELGDTLQRCIFSPALRGRAHPFGIVHVYNHLDAATRSLLIETCSRLNAPSGTQGMLPDQVTDANCRAVHNCLLATLNYVETQVYDYGSHPKRQLFHSFYLMSRNAALVVALLGLLVWRDLPRCNVYAHAGSGLYGGAGSFGLPRSVLSTEEIQIRL